MSISLPYLKDNSMYSNNIKTYLVETTNEHHVKSWHVCSGTGNEIPTLGVLEGSSVTGVLQVKDFMVARSYRKQLSYLYTVDLSTSINNNKNKMLDTYSWCELIQTENYRQWNRAQDIKSD